MATDSAARQHAKGAFIRAYKGLLSARADTLDAAVVAFAQALLALIELGVDPTTIYPNVFASLPPTVRMQWLTRAATITQARTPEGAS